MTENIILAGFVALVVILIVVRERDGKI